MNLNTNNLAIGNFMMKVNLKTMIIGILIIAATFLSASNNANGPTAFAQQPSCPSTISESISGLPGQTHDASTNIPLRGTDFAHGNEQINIPDIGSAMVIVTMHCG
jgi:hypothetical protein